MVSTTTSLWAEQSKNLIMARVRMPRPAQDPPSLLFNGYEGTFLALKWREREVNHALPPTIKVTTEQRRTSTPLTWRHSVDTNNFTLTIILQTSSLLHTQDSM
jgi:hypothetical protein